MCNLRASHLVLQPFSHDHAQHAACESCHHCLAHRGLVEQLMIDMFALQAGVAFRAFVLVLEDSLRPETCFQILRVAASTGNQRLYARSAAMALLHFQQAILQDPAGLQGLPREVLGSLLSHDYLQVNTHSAAGGHVALFPVKMIAAGPKEYFKDGVLS